MKTVRLNRKERTKENNKVPQITIPQTFHFCSWWAKFVLMMRKWFAKVFRLCAWVADSFLRVIHKQIWFHLIQANSSYRRLFLENALAD